MKKEEKPNFVINVDYVLEKTGMRREDLAKELGCNKQIFTDWKKKTPRIIGFLKRISEISGCSIEDFIKEENLS